MIAPADSIAPQFPSEISALFSPTGSLAKAANYEYRPQQQEMAEAIARCLDEQRHLLVEAGTGVGKSLAYLVPGITYALEHKKKLVVSTHTINLQQQLLHKDLPTAAHIIGREFKSAILMGRANYLCPRRLSRATRQAGDLFSGSENTELQRIADWSKATLNGVRSELYPEPSEAVWQQVCSEQHICTPRHCNSRNCFYQKARAEALEADVIIVNHSLFFRLLGDREYGKNDTGYIFANDFIVLDEAHTIENVAAKHIGVSFSEQMLRHTIHRLFNPSTKKGLLTTLHAGKVAEEIVHIEEAAYHFFDQLADTIKFDKNDEVRIRTPDIVPDSLSAPLARTAQMLAEVIKPLEDPDLRAEMLEMNRRICDIRRDLALLLSQSEPGFVYWASASQRKAKRMQLALHCAPLDLANHLRELLFRDNSQATLTSATLSIDGHTLDHLTARIGAEDAEQLILDSPFDYQRQMRVLIPKKMPDPRDADYMPALCREIAHHTARSDGHAFVLFNSYRDLRAAAQLLEPLFTRRGHTLIAQGAGTPRDEMLRTFRTTPRSILFGADSFWAGVDVPGDALTNVIITRLPFSPPDQPLAQAKCEAIDAAGGNSFLEYSIPEAILKFRQGAGRLIRSGSDRGTLVILDSRILQKNYGQLFLAALPECPREITDPAPHWEE